ncbi:acyltransferase [Paenibacillus sp. 19GGS1-52]|uniref:acyltransferase n=1 Tax=Paenibacillus sp. 19GGS1-52 TaxID=2758563 RepID=UPI001EFA8A9C|nr:acyltransferase [Paenibacillus sp. 19GGS1-52]ULO08640.1 acyltransferase [Paenibacillus sp. 19GGS1-52]
MMYINMIIRVIYNLFRLNILKLFRHKGIFFTQIQFLSVNTRIDIRGRNSRLTFKGRVSARTGVTLAVRNGDLVIGNNVFFNNGCIVTCHERIKIGDNCLFGPNVLFYDHDHIYGHGKIVNKEGYKKAPVELGNNIFVGANSVILKGSIIGDNCVIGAGTIIKGIIPANSLVHQKVEVVIKPIV